MAESFEKFRASYEKYVRKPFTRTKHLLFVVSYPRKLRWDPVVEKLTQHTCQMVSGGLTGSGSGHNIRLCYDDEVEAVLNESSCTHAMIVSVGFTYNPTVPQTAITNFMYFTKSKMFARGHIIAHPGKPAYLHRQHVELNLTKWREVGCPDMFAKWEVYIRPNDNYHDDYTPSWIEVPYFGGRVKNFSVRERNDKAFAYPEKADEKKMREGGWDLIKSGQACDSTHYFRQMWFPEKPTFYTHNSEHLRLDGLNKKYDLIVSPTAGFLTEVYANTLDFDGDIVFYDYCAELIKAKKMILNLLPSEDELRHLYFKDVKVDSTAGASRVDLLPTWPSQEVLQEYQKNIAKTNHGYRVWNLLDMNYDELAYLVEDRVVLFNASNIFGFYHVHLKYDLDYIIDKYEGLIEILRTHAKDFTFRGTNPAKYYEVI